MNGDFFRLGGGFVGSMRAVSMARRQGVFPTAQFQRDLLSQACTHIAEHLGDAICDIFQAREALQTMYAPSHDSMAQRILTTIDIQLDTLGADSNEDLTSRFEQVAQRGAAERVPLDAV